MIFFIILFWPTFDPKCFFGKFLPTPTHLPPLFLLTHLPPSSCQTPCTHLLLCSLVLRLGCHNFNFGLVTKAKACKGAGQKGSPRVTSHAPGSVGECKGMNLHTPKWAPTLGVGILMDFWIFKKWLQRLRPIALWSSLYHWKALRN
jgi:hypothetical protein